MIEPYLMLFGARARAKPPSAAVVFVLTIKSRAYMIVDMLENIEENIEEINGKLDLLLSARQADFIVPRNSPAKPVVCVLGMGYVGLPLAAVTANKGYEVYGYDLDMEKLKMIEDGGSPFKEEFLEKILPAVKINTFFDPRLMRLCDIFAICVPTPVDEKHYPIFDPVIDASKTIAGNMKPGALVILESTVNPGVCEEVIKPIFEKAGFVVGRDVFIAYCPERVNPGDQKWNVLNIPRVIGSFDDEGLRRSKAFYESIIDAPVLAMETIREAEAVKILENAFRDINIAFVNELAMSFSRLGIDITRVIKGASTKPFAFMAHWPGCGVGGHCIPVDPYYMIEKGKENNFDHQFLRAARSINDGMIEYTVELLREQLNEAGRPVKGTNIGILGLSYKANVGDLRESPSLKIIKILEKMGAVLHKYDPFVPQLSSARDLDELLAKSEAVLLTVNHQEFTAIPVEKFSANNVKIIIDGKNCLDKAAIKNAGILYKGIGR